MEHKPYDIKFTLEDARVLAEGNYHEEEKDEEEEEVVIEARNKTQYFIREENFYNTKLADFENAQTEVSEYRPRFVNLF